MNVAMLPSQVSAAKMNAAVGNAFVTNQNEFQSGKKLKLKLKVFQKKSQSAVKG